MEENMRISMYEVVGGPFCVASDDGQKIYDRLAAALAADRGVALSFHNVTALTPAFLDVAIGQLYGTFNENQIRSLLKVEDAELEDLAMVERVVANAKLYFEDPQRYEQAYREVMGEDDDEP